ncbi:type II toxin-antitoxin system RelE/ParE family toxin [Vibrio sp. 10N.261.51.A4]|uniref:type II toxin-antitoxin system RelE/ParE family toxin n=2 Tax=Vibrionaceae TaxID=641 RepID=UPI0035524E2E
MCLNQNLPKSNPLAYTSFMHTIVELPEYKKRVEKLLSEEENKQIINYLAEHPKAGVLMQGTGGIRKLRWAKEGSGKSGGVRVIYYYHSEEIPLFMLSLFGKNEKANLSKAECNVLNKLTKILADSYGR